jgi:hypothetical protein
MGPGRSKHKAPRSGRSAWGSRAGAGPGWPEGASRRLGRPQRGVAPARKEVAPGGPCLAEPGRPEGAVGVEPA